MPPTAQPVGAPGGYGDQGGVGPDGCFYASQPYRVVRVTNADGSCTLVPTAGGPTLALQPARQEVTAPADVEMAARVAGPAGPGVGEPVTFTVEGAHPTTATVSIGPDGTARFSYHVARSGVDTVRATVEVGDRILRASEATGTGSPEYTPADGYVGSDYIVYVASDGTTESEPAIARLEVEPSNRPPSAPAASLASGGEPVSFTPDARDPEGGAVTVRQGSAGGTPGRGLHGQVEQGGDTFVYTPDPGFTGSDIFIYTATDADGALTSAIVRASTTTTEPATTTTQASTTGSSATTTTTAPTTSLDPSGPTTSSRPGPPTTSCSTATTSAPRPDTTRRSERHEPGHGHDYDHHHPPGTKRQLRHRGDEHARRDDEHKRYPTAPALPCTAESLPLLDRDGVVAESGTPDPDPGSGGGANPFVVRAMGDTGDERLEVRAAGQVIGSFNATTAWTDYKVDLPAGTALADIQVAFVYDAVRGTYDRNLRVEHITYEGTTHRPDDPATLSTGTYYSWSKCLPGNFKSVALHCNGYFQFA